MGKNDAKRRARSNFCVLRRTQAVCVGAALAIGGVTLYYLRAQPAVEVNALPSQTVQTSYRRDDVLELVRRFSELPADVQKKAADDLVARIDQVTGMDRIYNSIITKTAPRMVSREDLEDLKKVAGYRLGDDDSDLRAQGIRPVACYNAAVDAVVIYPSEPSADLRRVLVDRLTPRSVLAHECLHKIQAGSSEHMRIDAQLWAHDYIRQGLAINLREFAMRPEIERLVRSASGEIDATDDRIIQLVSETITSSRDRVALVEVAARTLVPMFKKTDDGVRPLYSKSLVDQFSDMAAIERSLYLTATVYGLCLREGEDDIDIRVNTIIGGCAVSSNALERHLKAQGDTGSLLNQGIGFLYKRSERFEQVPRIAKEVLAEYGIR